MATFFDPRFKSNYFLEETINLVNKIKLEIMKFQPRRLEKHPSMCSSNISVLI